MQKQYDVDGHDFSIAGEASSNFKSYLKKLGIAPEVIRRVAIAMYEAEINTIIHGGGGICDAEVSKDRITITFRDHGPGIKDIDLAMQEGYSTASDQIREMGFGAGMGLPNMKRYTDEMDIESVVGSGTKITMKVRIS